MHRYASDSEEQIQIVVTLAVISVLLALAIGTIMKEQNIILPWWVESPSTMMIFGLLFKFFDVYAWRWRVFRKLGIISIPDLEGNWNGIVLSSYDKHQNQHSVNVDIKQTWTKISIRMKSNNSRSYSSTATIETLSNHGVVLTYHYCNEPIPSSLATMHQHSGTAILRLENPHALEGEYYTGKDRKTFGSLTLTWNKRP